MAFFLVLTSRVTRVNRLIPQQSFRFDILFGSCPWFFVVPGTRWRNDAPPTPLLQLSLPDNAARSAMRFAVVPLPCCIAPREHVVSICYQCGEHNFCQHTRARESKKMQQINRDHGLSEISFKLSQDKWHLHDQGHLQMLLSGAMASAAELLLLPAAPQNAISR